MCCRLWFLGAILHWARGWIILILIFLKVMPFSRERLLGSIWDWKFEQPKTTMALENLFCRDKYYPSSVGAHGVWGRIGGFIICVLD